LKQFLNIDKHAWNPFLQDDEYFLDLCISRREIGFVSTSKGRILGVNLETMQLVDEFSTKYVAESLLLTRKYLIVAQR
jgi:hypothetical protein